MTQTTGAQWAPDPSGRHQLRFWDGRTWTAHVMDEQVVSQDALDGPPGPDPRSAATTDPAGAGPKPLLPWWGHLMAGVASCGLWFVLAPAIHWFRQGAVKPALVWSGVWAVLIAFVALSGGSDGPVTTVAATTPAAVRSTLAPTTTTTTTSAAPVTTAVAPPPSPRALVAAPPVTTAAAPARAAVTTRRSTAPARTTKRTTTKRAATTTRTTKARRTTTKPPADPGTDRDYGTCAKAKAAGKGPYYAGIDVEYSWYRDADNDGKVCE